MYSIVWGLLLAALPLLAIGQNASSHRYQVLIHEIMADPTPAAGLPEQEFVELRNVGPTPVNLKGWVLKDSTGAMKLPEYWLQPDSLVVLAARPVFSPGIAGSGFPSLSNEGETLALYDAQGALVHAVAYRKSWYHGSIKDNGGWSLEMKDARWPCTGEANWAASTAPAGGTPGRPNSVAAAIPEPALPVLARISVTDSMQLLLHFSGGVDSASAAIAAHYSLPGIAAAVPKPPLFTAVSIRLTEPLQRGRSYSLQISGLLDCAGRPLGTLPEALLALPEAPRPGELVINEVLFDPPTGAPDFVEIYNNSAKALELYPLHLAGRGTDGALRQAVPLVTGPYMLLPGEYLAFTDDAAALCRAYACKGALLQVSALPTLPPDAGHVVLLHPNGPVVDELAYHRSFHLATLPATRGVSLERLGPSQPTQDPQNWHSAAATAGYATPGYQNSQWLPGSGGQESPFSVNPPAFSPNNDGQNDVAAVQWQLQEAGYTGTILVLDAQGRELRTLAGNLLLGTSGKVFWDGLNHQKMPAPPGIYVIFIRIFNPAGQVKAWKLPLVLTVR
ncbi:lamin tail domain-containing protein [Chitinophaga sp.]|uniref:lamin tail domain-containing protein n=1 Tax=Chitinophaga sp. TaxID=1869181 RepID=UPI0031D707B9